MATPQKHKVLVRAAYHLLQSPVARGTLYTMEAFADIMNKCIGASSNKYEIRVDGDLMTKAFAIKGKKKDGDFIPFTDHDIHEEFSGLKIQINPKYGAHSFQAS
mmetsp:Transcript_7308/g.11176  ORF Transcript_7308/g.11176 Transcript_7308/m.11176 type:complete len:104 (+) Transcript_7308:151-462(+)